MKIKRKLQKLCQIWALSLLFMVAPVFLGSTMADGLSSFSGEELSKIVQGGILYDKWWKHLGADEPEGTHPSYTVEGKKKGSATWRCKECHGWDYKGKRGAYRKGSHYSGISGIRNMAGSPETDVVAVLKDETHQFDGVIPQVALEKLAAFVSKGQIENDDYIDRISKKVSANVENGARIFQTICATCHGIDGSEINFGNKDAPKFVGTVARSNPCCRRRIHNDYFRGR